MFFNVIVTLNLMVLNSYITEPNNPWYKCDSLNYRMAVAKHSSLIFFISYIFFSMALSLPAKKTLHSLLSKFPIASFCEQANEIYLHLQKNQEECRQFSPSFLLDWYSTEMTTGEPLIQVSTIHITLKNGLTFFNKFLLLCHLLKLNTFIHWMLKFSSSFATVEKQIEKVLADKQFYKLLIQTST